MSPVLIRFIAATPVCHIITRKGHTARVLLFSLDNNPFEALKVNRDFALAPTNI